MLPVLALLGANGRSGDPHEIAESLLISIVQVLIIAAVFRPLEAFAPAEQWADRRYARIDRFYTIFKLLVVLPLFTYVMLPSASAWFGLGAVASEPPGAESLLSVQAEVPALGRHPLLSFLIYFAIFDLVYYGIHRLQHALPWWWALHSLHHSQRQLNCWSNDRDHYLDDLLELAVISAVSFMIGVAPVDYALLILLGALVECLSHANVRLRFGRVVDKVLVDPRYHRLHHMVIDRQAPGKHNCNFALVLPIWTCCSARRCTGRNLTRAVSTIRASTRTTSSASSDSSWRG